MADTARIFIVDDERRIARFLQMELEHEGFRTATESNGRRAYERILQEQFDLVLLDLMLPDMDGLEICKSVRKLSDVPIIMLTALGSESSIGLGRCRGIRLQWNGRMMEFRNGCISCDESTEKELQGLLASLQSQEESV